MAAALVAAALLLALLAWWRANRSPVEWLMPLPARGPLIVRGGEIIVPDVVRAGGSRAIEARPVTGGPARVLTLQPVGSSWPGPRAVTGTHLYCWVAAPPAQTARTGLVFQLCRVPLRGGPSTPIKTDTDSFGMSASNAVAPGGAVYWTTAVEEWIGGTSGAAHLRTPRSALWRLNPGSDTPRPVRRADQYWSDLRSGATGLTWASAALREMPGARGNPQHYAAPVPPYTRYHLGLQDGKLAVWRDAPPPAPAQELDGRYYLVSSSKPARPSGEPGREAALTWDYDRLESARLDGSDRKVVWDARDAGMPDARVRDLVEHGGRLYALLYRPEGQPRPLLRLELRPGHQPAFEPAVMLPAGYDYDPCFDGGYCYLAAYPAARRGPAWLQRLLSRFLGHPQRAMLGRIRLPQK